MNAAAEREARIEKRVRHFINTGHWPKDPACQPVIPDHDNPKIESKFNADICPHCNVRFVTNKNRGDVDADGNEDGFHKVCPLCGLCPY